MSTVVSRNMLEVICEDCHEVQTTTVFGAPECEACGSRSLTETTGCESQVPSGT
jgi:ribosomal protein S27E